MEEKPQNQSILEEPKRLSQEHPADIARILLEYSEKDALRLIEELPLETLALALEEMAPEISAPFLLQMDGRQVAQLLEEMSTERAVDILHEMDSAERDLVLSHVNGMRVTQILRFLSYPDDSVGSIMSPELTTLSKDIPVKDAIQSLRKKREECENLHYVYVTDNTGVLQGVLFLRDLIFNSPDAKISDIMHTEVTTVGVDQDKEKAAALLDRYHYLALPVIDSGNRLLGIVTVDSVIDVIQDEASEDLQIMVGAGGDERVYTPILWSFRKRLPWLWFNLLASFVTASVIGLFQNIIAQITILAVFFPIVANQGGNAGAQTLAVTIRGIALGEADASRSWQVLLRQLLLGLLNGCVIGITASVVAYFVSGKIILGVVIGIAMFVNLVVAGFMGAFIPLGLKRMGLDPAQSSSIFLTIITDSVGFLSFLGLASLFIRFF